MDGRRGYSDEPESQWYSGQGHVDGDWERPGEGGWRADIPVPEGRHRGYTNPDLHPQSPAAHLTHPVESPTNPLAAVSPGSVSPGAVSPGPVDVDSSGTGLPGSGAPTLASPGMDQVGVGPPVAPAMPVPPAAGSPLSGPPTVGSPAVGGPPPAAPAPREGVYRTRRPALAVLYLIGVLLCEWPAVRLFADGAFGDHVSSSTAVSGLFLIIGLPLFGRGLFAVQAGAGRVPDQRAGHAWLQPPVAYLTVGLVLLLAAGLAA